jgi:hypothetical protein
MTAAIRAGFEGRIAATERDRKRPQLLLEFLRELSKLHWRIPLSVNEVPIPTTWTACSGRTIVQTFHESIGMLTITDRVLDDGERLW